MKKSNKILIILLLFIFTVCLAYNFGKDIAKKEREQKTEINNEN